MTRGRLTAVLLAAVEVWFFARYAQAGAQFHYWLHALLGGALGLSVLTVVRLLRPARATWRGHEATLTGHLWSAVPDVLFLSAGVLHVSWMDVFAVHITAHFLWPAPLPAALVLWALAVAGWAAARLGARRAAASAVLLTAGFLAVAVDLHAPLPRTLQEVVRGGSDGGPERAWSWVCSVDT